MNYYLGKRILAGLFDYVLLYALIFAYVFLVGTPNDEGGYTVTGSLALVVPALWFLYFPVMETLQKQTLGKMIFGLQVTGSSNVDPGFVEIMKRRSVDIIDFGFFGIPALITILKTEKRQRLGDLWGETMIVSAEETTCPYCSETIHLEGREVVRRFYTCPSCKKAVNMAEV